MTMKPFILEMNARFGVAIHLAKCRSKFTIIDYKEGLRSEEVDVSLLTERTGK